MITMSTSVDVARPADLAWSVLGDYDQDPRWRRGVSTMAPSPPGPARPGTRTDEHLRFAGRWYRNGGIVLTVGPGRSLTWRTTSGVEAEGTRGVEDLGPGRCRVHLETQVQPTGLERLLSPVLGAALRRNLAGDAERLRTLLESDAFPPDAG